MTYSKSSPTPQVLFSRNSVLRSYFLHPLCTCIFVGYLAYRILKARARTAFFRFRSLAYPSSIVEQNARFPLVSTSRMQPQLRRRGGGGEKEKGRESASERVRESESDSERNRERDTGREGERERESEIEPCVLAFRVLAYVATRILCVFTILHAYCC